MEVNLTKSAALVLFICGALAFTACSKKDDDPVTKPEETRTVEFNKLTRVENFSVNANLMGGTAGDPVFFSLETQKQIPAEQKNTKNWDLAFANILNSFVSGNNGADKKNYGYGNKATGGVLIVEKPFEEVTNVPEASKFLTGKDVYGTDPAGDLSEGNLPGWYLYDFDGTIIGNGSAAKTHIAYALGNQIELSNGNPAPVRTLLVRTAKGNFAKIRMISVYKNQFLWTDWKKDSEKTYLTFEYVLVPAGSTKFELK
ncbi:HmuY family protein [Pelobium manganitolerans]|uniref:HmuY family protein n=1 Tax=Pelobium manganitolerans TaxID=1842495 RepID=UPI003FA3584D